MHMMHAHHLPGKGPQGRESPIHPAAAAAAAAPLTAHLPWRFDLSGSTAFVTGAGSGIGAAIALGMARSGADIILAGVVA